MGTVPFFGTVPMTAISLACLAETRPSRAVGSENRVPQAGNPQVRARVVWQRPALCRCAVGPCAADFAIRDGLLHTVFYAARARRPRCQVSAVV